MKLIKPCDPEGDNPTRLVRQLGFSAPYFLQTDITAEMTSGLVDQHKSFLKCIPWTSYSHNNIDW